MTGTPIRTWLAAPLDEDVRTQLERVRRVPGVRRVAVMPDVHLARDVCVGTVVATEDLLLPACVGGDIGCGVTTVALGTEVSPRLSGDQADLLLELLSHIVPIRAQPRARREPLPATLVDRPLSCLPLRRLAEREGETQLGTLGRGNHFVELQRDEGDGLWLLVHSGSRGLGPAIRDYHLQSGGLQTLAADSPAGRAYLGDMTWAREYARLNRERILHAALAAVHAVLGVEPLPDTWLDCDHNHVRRQGPLWIHRKGAISAALDEPGVILGSMGAATFHTSGRGCAQALFSSSHGAGRRLSRTEARRRISARALRRQMGDVRFRERSARELVAEAPSAYRDIVRVMRAQSDLTRVVRKLRPLLNYKGSG